MNRYAYAFNNPLSFTDPSGWWPEDPPEDYDEPYSYAPTGGGDVYYRLNRWYNGPADPFAGMGFDFEGKLHDAYINTTSHRNRDIGPGADYYLAKNYVLINGEYRYRGDASVSDGLSWVSYQVSVTSMEHMVEGSSSPGRDGRQMRGFRGYEDHVYHYDKKTNTYYIPWSDQKINPADIMTGELDWFVFSDYSEFEYYKSDPSGWYVQEHMYDIPYDPPLINVYPEFDLIFGLRALSNFARRGTTIYQYRNGKNFRVDLDNRNWLHYHRRAVGPGGKTIPGQGIGRHRPWQRKSFDVSFWDRF